MTVRALGGVSEIILLFDHKHNELCMDQTALRTCRQAKGPRSPSGGPRAVGLLSWTKPLDSYCAKNASSHF